MKEFAKYESMRSKSADALSVYQQAKADGLDQIARIRMLRAVFGLSLDDAKKVSFEGDTGEKYEDQKGRLTDEFKKVLDDELGSE